LWGTASVQVITTDINSYHCLYINNNTMYNNKKTEKNLKQQQAEYQCLTAITLRSKTIVINDKHKASA